MPKIALVSNIYEPIQDLQAYQTVAAGSFLVDFLREQFPDGVTTPLRCFLNSEEIPFTDWDKRPLAEGDKAVFVPHVGTTVIIAIVIAIIVAVAVVLFLDFPVPKNDGQPEADPVYSLKGQQNQVKFNEPIEKHYGKGRHWPSYAARPYNKNEGQNQVLFALLCIGLSDYEIPKIRVDDTDLANLEEVQTQICAPGEAVTLFPINVQTADEVSGIEMKGPNEPDVPDDGGWYGWYTIVTAGNRATRIELDVSWRQGMYRTTDKGKFKAASSASQFQIRQINDLGEVIGDTQPFLSVNRTLATSDSWRETVGANVPAGRWQIRGRRTNNKATDYKIRDAFTWDSVRAYCENKQDFGNVTLLAIKARASNNLNDQSRGKFNVDYEAYTDVYDLATGIWTPQITRNPVWAFCDILRAEYGRALPDYFLDLPTLVNMANALDAASVTFDWTYDQRGTIWPALQTALMIARAKPILPNALFSAVRDVPASVPVVGFSQYNIVPDSFSVSTKLAILGDHDGLEVEYINPLNWTKESVLCLIGEDQGNNPRQVRLSGCTDRTKAYRWGLYTRACEVEQRDNIVFETGLEGADIIYGDLAAIQHDLIPTDYSLPEEFTGRLDEDALVNFDDGGGNRTYVTLPALVMFEPGETHRIALRDRRGVVRGPFVCTATADPFTVKLATLLNLAEFNVTGGETATYFFGVSGKEYMLSKVVNVAPAGESTIRITAVPYSENVYSYENAEPPPPDVIVLPPVVPAAPVVENLDVSSVPDSLLDVLASWSPALGAFEYVVELSLDGVGYTEVGRTAISSYRVPIEGPGTIFVKVYGIGQLAGPPAIWTGEVGVADQPPGQVANLRVDGSPNGPTLALLWDSVGNADRYWVRIYIGANLIGEYETELTSFLYTGAQAAADADATGLALTGSLNIAVAAENAFDMGLSSNVLTVTNSAPTSPARTTASVVTPTPTGYRTLRVGYTHANSDLARIEVIVGPSVGVPTTGTEGTDWFRYDAPLASPGSVNVLFPTGWGNVWIKFRTWDVWGNYLEGVAYKIYPSF